MFLQVYVSKKRDKSVRRRSRSDLCMCVCFGRESSRLGISQTELFKLQIVKIVHIVQRATKSIFDSVALGQSQSQSERAMIWASPGQLGYKLLF